jgi:capsular exopolysaccharide synthesis family protein
MERLTEAKVHFLDYWRVIRVRLGLVIAVFVLVVLATGVATYLAPRQYKSFVTLEVQPDMTPVRIFEHQTQPGASDDLRFGPTQFQIISRKGVLYPVIERLNLQAKWAAEGGKPLAMETAYNKLLGMLSVEEIRNTRLIQISIYSPKPQEAALLANTIASVYMEQRVAEQQAIVAKGLDQLRDEVKQKEKAVSQAYAEASRLRTQANIIDPNPDSLETSGRVEDSSVISNQEKVNEARSQVATLQSRAAGLDHLNSGDLMRAAGELNLNDPVIAAKLPVYQTAVAEKARLLNAGLGPNHPDIKALQAQIDTIAAQLQQQIDSVRKGLLAQLSIAQSSLQALEANLQSSQTEQQALKTASAQYLDAKYKYIQERKLLELVKTRLSTESMERTMPQTPAFVRDPAEPALFPSKPSVFKNLLLGVAAGLVLSISLAFFLEHLDTSLRTMDDVEEFLELPILGIIPKRIKLLPKADEDSPDAEAYRILKTNVDFSRKKLNDAAAFNVISGGAGEGKSTTVCNLATSWAASGQRVLIIDGDMRRPSQHRLLEMSNRPGLGDYLRGKATLDQVIQPTMVGNLYLVPAGSRSPNAVSLLSAGAMEKLIQVARQRFDIIVIDSPPLLGVSDASILSSLVDGSIIVIQHRRFPRAMLLRVKKTVHSIDTRAVGVVLNQVDVRHDRNYQYYTSYHQYYGQRHNGAKKEPPPTNHRVLYPERS